MDQVSIKASWSGLFFQRATTFPEMRLLFVRVIRKLQFPVLAIQIASAYGRIRVSRVQMRINQSRRKVPLPFT
jgi:hypothetical protein